jgi:hypothetical protein
MLQLPSPGCHPVLIARKLLFLGSLLQGAVSTTRTGGMTRERLSVIMCRAIDTATRLVTTNDALTASVEGVECIMIEAMIQNYTGNLHRAWMTARRASAVAQLIGLHRHSATPMLKVLDPETKADFDPEVLCFRIVELDYYLSITLGLPHSSLDCRALTAEALAKCEPLDRMARLQCIFAGRMFRHDSAAKKAENLQEMEVLLQQAANEMPPQWWLIPELAPGSGTPDSDPMQEVARVNYQFSHYHLALRLHMPYILRSSGCNQSKLLAATASREILTRYLTFRRWNPGNFYCRGVDLLAFVAVTALCLVHIDSRNRQTNEIGKLLSQSHLSDRGMMERSVEILKQMRDDVSASKLSRIMQHLLDVEAEAASGVGFNAVATETGDGNSEYDGAFVDGRNTLQLHIPYFGTICFHRKPIIHTSAIPNDTLPDQIPTQSQQSSAQWDSCWSHQGLSSGGDVDSYNDSAELAGMFDFTNDMGYSDDLTLQSINESLFSSLFDGLDGYDAMLGAGESTVHRGD